MIMIMNIPWSSNSDIVFPLVHYVYENDAHNMKCTNEQRVVKTKKNPNRETFFIIIVCWRYG